MTTQKKILKGLIIFILIAFLLSTALTSIMYFSINKNTSTTGENLTQIQEITGQKDLMTTNQTGNFQTGKN